MYHKYVLTTPNASPIDIHVNCLNSAVEVYFSTMQCAYHDKPWAALFFKTGRYGFVTQIDFQLHPLACKNITTVQIRQMHTLFLKPDPHPSSPLYLPARLSRNNYIWYLAGRRHRVHVLIKYRQNYRDWNIRIQKLSFVDIFCLWLRFI